jgi:hypothetical protein
VCAQVRAVEALWATALVVASACFAATYRPPGLTALAGGAEGEEDEEEGEEEGEGGGAGAEGWRLFSFPWVAAGEVLVCVG